MVAAANIARWDRTHWLPFGGTDGDVMAMITLPGGDLAVGGFFATAGGIQARDLARWNGTRWSEGRQFRTARTNTERTTRQRSGS